MANTLLNAGLQLYDLYQINDSFGEARDDLKSGFNQARSDVTSTQKPYSDFGLPHMQDYNAMGEFGFDFNNDYLNSANYKWLQQQGQQGVERSAAASPQGFLSGKTLADISQWNQQFAQSQYQQEWERQMKEYDTNRAYHEYPITTGAGAAANVGNNLADISIGRGAAMAQFEAERAALISKALGSTGAAINSRTGLSGDLGSVGGIAGTFMDTVGNVIDSTGNIISNIWDGGGLDGYGDWGLLGDLGGLITGAFGSGANPGTPQEWDLFDTVDFDQISAEGIAFLEDDSIWNQLSQDLGSIWNNTGGKLIDWAKGFF